ncbi:MAG TPA: chemotaxis protein CheB [Polyangia bacterium]|jgi:two-component system chemotaxis response regulator CheB
MAKRDIVVVGASAGGVSALDRLVAALPEDFSASLFVVMHLKPDGRSHLVDILQRNSRLPIVAPDDGDAIEPGHVYVAQADHHLLVDDRTVRITRGPKENRNRPAIDALFRSAAYLHGERAIGVVLSGVLDDGTAGLWSIKERGGIAIVQSPDDAEYGGMPKSAIEYVDVDYVCAIEAIPPLLRRLTTEPIFRKPAPISKQLEIEARIALEGRGLQMGVMELGPVVPYTCPECYGAMVDLSRGSVPRFRCQTGHAYSINNLLAEVSAYAENSLWNGIRAIEESMMLLDQMARRAREAGDIDGQSAAFTKRSKEALKRAELVRDALLAPDGPTKPKRGND